jgi:membrane-associated phospholipid phosphatase
LRPCRPLIERLPSGGSGRDGSGIRGAVQPVSSRPRNDPATPGERVFEPELDRRVLRAAVPRPGSTSAAVLRPITWLGDGLKPWLLASAVLWLTGKSDRRRRTVVSAWAAIGIASAISVLLKHLINRQRPSPERFGLPKQGGKEPSGPSFPSSHTASAVAFALAAGASEPAVGPVLVPVAVTVAGTRLASGHHYATDVLAGAVVGVVASVVVAKWRDRAASWLRLGEFGW